ncbi:MAG: A/G-specific adenine glycosylase [Bacteroidota bacterium]|nr:A/G-specific adenine glycosylase [Bacteroidota bacterium]
MNNRNFSKALQDWYLKNKRELPWRDTTNPYKIWLSEVILQQTRVAQGLPYFYEFLDQYPTVEDLAAASQEEVLRVWQGLGYYSRARNLHACAQEIAFTMGGDFPGNYKSLLKLKGIGTYTAAAIASFAFKESVAVVDGNVVRVISRFFGIEKDISTPEGKIVFAQLANELIDVKNPDIHNQAMMEFGALHCTPMAPKCQDCIFISSCFAYQHDMQNYLPLKPKKIKIRNRHFFYMILEYKGKLFMKKRVENDIWQGLYDFFLVENPIASSLAEIENDFVARLISLDYDLNQVPQTFIHKLTHQKISVQFYHFKIIDEILAKEILNFANFALYSYDEIMSIPKPILINKYLFKK